MAKGPDGTARLKSLRAALVLAKKLPSGTVLDMAPMCKILSVTQPTLRGWVEEILEIEAPETVDRGGRGMKYEFKPVPAIRALIAHFTRKGKIAAQKSREFEKSIGVQLSESEGNFTTAEARQSVGMTIDLTKWKIATKQLMVAELCAQFIERYNRRQTEKLMGVGTKIDPTGQFSPELRQAILECHREICVEQTADAEEFIEECRAGFIQAGDYSRS